VIESFIILFHIFLLVFQVSRSLQSLCEGDITIPKRIRRTFSMQGRFLGVLNSYLGR